MIVRRSVLSRVEGTAQLILEWKEGRITDAKISIPSARGIERVLIGRPIMDALVINPRVCGICGHAHLMATVRAIEAIIPKLKVPEKAQLLRDITLSLEILQNHIKWFYLFVLPDFTVFFPQLSPQLEPFKGSRWRSAVTQASLIGRGIALLSGQYPHNSYAVPGGITSCPGEGDIVQVLQVLRSTKDFFLRNVVGMEEEDFLKIRQSGDWEMLRGDVGMFIQLCGDLGMMSTGVSYGTFFTGGEIFPCIKPGHHTGKKKVCFVNLSKITVRSSFPYSSASYVRYNGTPYETGPLARQLINSNPFVKRMYQKYGGSYLVRVLARVLEIWEIITILEQKLKRLLEVSHERSCVPQETAHLSGEGWGVVEAARGTLIHRLVADRGTIVGYQIITPSQWNLGPRCDRFLGVAERALLGLDNPVKAEMVLRSFDVCSVCTTH
ncbi:nickel-dependent hydrogenase large subunit [Thermocrinis albus DSM 14484]|uniref:Nickel-dependent hydrogenase large subunit n=1 Tax=Thermocrinis albus (strain DSM 14484 / JCM 11386 / HI 11/12) TaxID=638303 RepID=D3SMR3_THEAH|nr:nickel-dependent hydrogenase large subunit [Thermocrinis albus]ADC90043.1 nickel-dependent hydrogenase large subunit [Thermocrinis albus DSM 14484]